MTFGVVASSGPLAAADYPDVVLADSPLLYWRLGEASGTTVNDEQGAYDSGYLGSPTLGATGIPGGGGDTAVTFDGTDDEIRRGTSAAFWVDGTDGAAYECWYKGTDTGNFLNGNAACGILAANTDGSQKRFIICIDGNGKAQAWTGTNYEGCGPSTTTINDDNWHHLVLAIEGGSYDVRLYVDGTLEASNTGGSNNAGSLNPSLTVARNARPGSSGYCAGTIDEVAVYKPGGATALSAARIAAHYSAGSSA